MGKKLEIKEIEDRTRKQVTFSKRKKGIASKACEMAILCDADIGIFIFSEGCEPITIGSRNINNVINRYLDNPVSMDQTEDPENMNAKLLQFTDLKNNLKREKDRHDDFSKMREKLASQNEYYWWRKDIDCFELNQLLIYRTALEGLKARIRDCFAHETHNAARNSDFVNNSVFQDPQQFNPNPNVTTNSAFTYNPAGLHTRQFNPNFLTAANSHFTNNPIGVDAGQFNPNQHVAANSAFTCNPTGLGIGQFNPNLLITANSDFTNNPIKVDAVQFNPNPQMTTNSGFINHPTDVGTEQYNSDFHTGDVNPNSASSIWRSQHWEL